MKNLFLKSKHWQIFVFLFALPMVLQILFMPVMVSTFDAEAGQELLIAYGVVFGLVTLISVFVFFGWIWSVCVGLQPYLPDDSRMKMTRFKIIFFLPFACALMMIIFTALALTGNAFDYFGSIDLILLGLTYLIAVFCIFYCFYFAAKTIKTVELQEEVKFRDFIGEFFMIWFLFIGIWIIQPKINQLVEEEFSYVDSLI